MSVRGAFWTFLGTGQLAKRLRSALGPVLGTLMVAYVAYHSLHGDRGLLAFHQLSQHIAVAEAEAHAAATLRADWEHRVRHLGNQSLDLDLLEERARVMLNMGHTRDVVFLTSNTSALRHQASSGATFTSIAATTNRLQGR